MRRILLLIFWQFGLVAGGRLFADVVTLKDGRQISGLVESGNTQELHIKVGDQSQTVDIQQVQAIQFGVSLPAPPAAPPPANAADLAPQPAPAAAPTNANAFLPVTEVKSAGLTRCGKVETGAVESRAGGDALTFTGAFTGKGPKNAPETPFTNRLTQPTVVNSKQGRQ
jgi:hypothetical protein